MSDSKRSVDGDFSVLLNFDCRLLLFLFQVVIFDQNRIFSIFRNKQLGLQFVIYRWVIQFLGTIRQINFQKCPPLVWLIFIPEVLFIVFEKKLCWKERSNMEYTAQSTVVNFAGTPSSSFSIRLFEEQRRVFQCIDEVYEVGKCRLVHVRARVL